MTTLNTVSPQQSEGKVAEIYQQVSDTFGFIPNAMHLYSVSPAAMERQWSYLSYNMQHPKLSNLLLALIRLLVSANKGCDYCVNLNTGILLQNGLSIEAIQELKQDTTRAPLEEADMAMLQFVLKATNDAPSRSAEEVQQLRDVGFDDKDIFDAVQHGAHMVAVEILFDTFNLENDQM